MKTKIRTLAAICVLGFIGTINVKGADYKNANNNVITEEGKNTKVSLVALTEKTSFESNARFETAEFLLNDDAEAMIDLEKKPKW